MKRNVDLSESRMFTTPEEPTGLFKLLIDAIKVTKPWDFEHNPRKYTDDMDDYLFSSRTIFATGTKKERVYWKRNRDFDEDNVCESCGKDRGNKPWAKNRCNCFSMAYTPKIPWKF